MYGLSQYWQLLQLGNVDCTIVTYALASSLFDANVALKDDQAGIDFTKPYR